MKKPVRKNLALAIDGGGIRGTMVAKALAIVVESEPDLFKDRPLLLVGTSTGSIISAGLSVGLSPAEIYNLYVSLAAKIFPKTWWSRISSTLCPRLGRLSKICSSLVALKKYRYSSQPLEDALKEYLGEKRMSDLMKKEPNRDLVIVIRDMVENRPRFVKPYKNKYQDWFIWEAVVASSTVPTYFPVFKKRFVDGGVGSYGNPCYVAGYEILFCIDNWDLEDTTLISIGTGKTDSRMEEDEVDRLRGFDWIWPTIDAFSVDAAHQQVDLVHRLMKKLDFRRFNVNLSKPIAMDDTDSIEDLTTYGNELGIKILNDETEPEGDPPPTVFIR